MQTFSEENSSFYDLEYFLSLEYRYLSGAHRNKIKNVFSSIGPVNGKKCLDVGCGGGLFANELAKRGADVTAIDYSASAIQFARERYPELNFKVVSALELGLLPLGNYDVVTLFDVIEHVSDQDKLLAGIYNALKPEGIFVATTDVAGNFFNVRIIRKLINASMLLSSNGRAFRMIRKVETERRLFKNYHLSHVKELSFDEFNEAITSRNFRVVKHLVYPLVSVPVRDLFLRFLLNELNSAIFSEAYFPFSVNVFNPIPILSFLASYAKSSLERFSALKDLQKIFSATL